MLSNSQEHDLLRDLSELLAAAPDPAHILPLLVRRTAEVYESETARLRDAAKFATERANTLNAVFNTMTEGLLVINEQGQVILHNNSAAHFINLSSPNLIDYLTVYLEYNPAYTVYGSPIATEDFPLLRALRGEHIRGERFMSKRKDGSEYALEVNAAPLFDSEERQIGIVSALRDITEHVRAEQRIRRALETMLHAAEAVSCVTDGQEIFRRVLDMTLAALNCERGVVLLYDQETRLFHLLLSINFSPEEVDPWLAEQQCWSSPISEQETGFHGQLLQGHATLVSIKRKADQKSSFPMILATPIMHNDHLIGVMLLDRTEKVRREFERFQQGFTNSVPTLGFSAWDMAVIEGIGQFAGMAIEQTRWKQEAEIAHINEASMRESNKLKDEFLAITAHEFRTPLTVILANSQMMVRQLRKATAIAPEFKEKLSESLSAIEEQTHQLTNFVNTFLEVTALNEGKIMIAQDEVQLENLIRETIAHHSATSSKHPIHCQVEPSPLPYLVKGDRARLTQIISNLLQNAIKYSPFGGPITVSLHQSNAHIAVSVEDKGIGIPKESQPHLFERFYRASNIGGNRVRGVGLGLYLVAEFLRLHNGDIRVKSSGIAGEGSCFTFTLPLYTSAGSSGNST